ncbi:translation initiation factor IF-3 [Buchnera aphidicola]|uniref:translation initiation factor IF-3 n=1 Tax=Buchnera aphidicola TaxID=9 RepID=UPI0031B702EB
MKGGKRINSSKMNRINQEIRASEVRLTDVKGDQIGIFSLKDALKKAEILGVDLVEISPNATPPVCKMMNYGKFLYEKTKLLKEQRKKQKIIQIKEIKFRPSTEVGDYQVKLKKLIRFLKNGDKVKITLRFRGREMAHQEIGINMLKRIKNDLFQFSTIEYFPRKIEGRQMVMILSPKKNK